MRFHDPGVWLPPADADQVTLALEEQMPLVELRVRGPSRLPQAAHVEFGTGQTGALTLTGPFVDRSGLVTDAQARSSITAGALVPGRVGAYVTRLDAIELGDIVVRSPVVNVASEDGAGVSGSTVGLLGGEILRRFDLFVDYSRARVLLFRNRDFAAPIEFDMSGMSLSAGGSAWSEVRVRAVVPGGPADAAGIAAGDLLTVADGRAVATVGLTAIRRMRRVPDVSRTLTVTRNGAARTVAIHLHRLV